MQKMAATITSQRARSLRRSGHLHTFHDAVGDAMRAEGTEEMPIMSAARRYNAGPLRAGPDLVEGRRGRCSSIAPQTAPELRPRIISICATGTCGNMNLLSTSLRWLDGCKTTHKCTTVTKHLGHSPRGRLDPQQTEQGTNFGQRTSALRLVRCWLAVHDS